MRRAMGQEKQHKRRSIATSTAKTICILALATLLSMALSVCTFELILRNAHLIKKSSTILITLVVAFATVSMPFAISIYAADAAFRRRAAMDGLLVICAGYLAVLLSFAGVYYSFNVVSDYQESRDFADFYVHVSTRLDQGTFQRVPERIADQQAFHGMRYLLWSTLSDEAKPSFMHRGSRVPEDFLVVAARRYGPWPDGNQTATFRPTFRGDQRLPSLLQCIHFSVVTMATVGYGDVHPNQWYSRLAVDMQILIGQILIVVALGCVLGRWWERPLM